METELEERDFPDDRDCPFPTFGESELDPLEGDRKSCGAPLEIVCGFGFGDLARRESIDLIRQTTNSQT